MSLTSLLDSTVIGILKAFSLGAFQELTKTLLISWNLGEAESRGRQVTLRPFLPSLSLLLPYSQIAGK